MGIKIKKMNCKLQVCSDKHQRKFDVELLNGLHHKYQIVTGPTYWDPLEIKVDDKLFNYIIDWALDLNDLIPKKVDIILYGYKVTNMKLIGIFPISCETSPNGGENIVELRFDQLEIL